LSFLAARAIIALRFPGVRSIDPAGVSAWLADASRRPPLLVDVREPAEYEVSHLPEAVNAPLSGGTERILTRLAPETPVVTYCSVGYRSAIAATRLRAAGHTNVINLEGSIFEWANEGRPLERNGEPTRKVHPYSPWFTWLLRDRGR
jgi:rhodanese-related sulfurtransferase